MSDRNRHITLTMQVSDNNGVLQTVTIEQRRLTNDEAMQAQVDIVENAKAGLARLAASQGNTLPSPTVAA